jgi:dihydroflavonol-4-reductase
LAAAAVDELVLGRLGLEPHLAFDGVRMAKERMFYDSSKAVRELGLPQSPVNRALADAASWFRSHGLLARPDQKESPNEWQSPSGKR